MAERKIGLAIGINDYSDPKLSNLLFAKKDAEDMREILLDPNIGEFDDIIPLVDETGYNVKKGIEKLLLKDSTFNDLVLIYFSGHGKLNSKFELNLLLKDTETDYLLSTALHYNFITDCIEESKCKKIIIILDCCHSGAADAKGDFSKPLSETSGSGTFILSATTGSNLAKEAQELENGIFTHFLLEGLMKGDADLGGDGLIDILEWYEYASKKCNDKYSQVTTIKTKFEERIVIGKNPLKIREKEYELKTSRLLEDFVSQLSPCVLNESLTILKKYYEVPSSLEKIEVEICRLLNFLLKGELSVENYNIAVQHLKTPKTFTSPSTGMEFVLIPAGEFMMGSFPNEKGRHKSEGPVRKVKIEKSLYMSKYPVTQKQWVAVMGDNPSRFKGDDLPVESVSYEDIQKFIKELNDNEDTGKYFLPSEAEWEYACRGDTTTRYSFGDDGAKLEEYAWYKNKSDYKTHPVGQKKPNSWDLYDTHGNVWEWVQDIWHDSYNGAPSDGSAWEDGSSSYRVVRGGSWNSISWCCRSASRYWFAPKKHDIVIGFRLLKKL